MNSLMLLISVLSPSKVTHITRSAAHPVCERNDREGEHMSSTNTYAWVCIPIWAHLNLYSARNEMLNIKLKTLRNTEAQTWAPRCALFV